MAEPTLGFQVSEHHDEKEHAHTLERPDSLRRKATMTSSIGQFIIDDIKLFVSPIRVLVEEFRRQVKR
jgi:hypothetical protein